MEKTRTLLPQDRSFTVRPRRTARGCTAEVKNVTGTVLASCDEAGTVRDHEGALLLRAPLSWRGAGGRATDAGLDVTDDAGRPLWTARVVGYGFGPGARKVTVAVAHPSGAEVARLEPRDRRGQELALHAAGTDVAALSVRTVRTGFWRTARVCSVRTADTIPDELRALVLALAVRYDALLDAAQRVEQPD